MMKEAFSFSFLALKTTCRSLEIQSNWLKHRKYYFFKPVTLHLFINVAVSHNRTSTQQTKPEHAHDTVCQE